MAIHTVSGKNVFIRTTVWAAVALVLGGCASRGTSAAGGAEPEYTGIQTRAIRDAPQTQQARNDSRPLSELNTPDAIAAREALARTAPTRAPAAKVTAAPAAAAPAVAAAAAPSHQKNESLQKGAKVRTVSNAALHARPNATSDSVPAPAGVLAELGPQIYNADGYWWYVTAGNESGWLLQTDIAP